MSLTTLDVVNNMLGAMGELPINDVEEAHPLVPAALRHLREANQNAQAPMWWFNLEYPTLTPDEEGKIILPLDTASADSLTEYPRVAMRGRFLYNLDDATGVFTCPVRVRLHRIVPFEDAPVCVRAYVSAKAQIAFSAQYDGDTNKIAVLQETMRQAYLEMKAEDTRSEKANLLRRSGVAHIMQRMTKHYSSRFNRGSRYS